MKLAIIVAVATSKDGVIGSNNQLPWHLPEDLKYFKSVTLGKPVIMGRKTYESIGRPLPGRTNIVITRSTDWSAEGVVVVNSLEHALDQARAAIAASTTSVVEAMIIGGAEIYRSALPLVDKVYLTRVEIEIDGDAFFPELPATDWKLTSSTPGDKDALIPHQFFVYERIR
jgi:dihydrofolate reductase